MNLEIHKPELLKRVNAHIQAGHFHDADEFIEKALDALEEKAPVPVLSHDERTGADLIAALQASPYRELEIEPPRPACASATCETLCSDGMASRYEHPFGNTTHEAGAKGCLPSLPGMRSMSFISVLSRWPNFASASNC